MRVGRLTVERRSNAEVRALRQRQINAVRKGGYRKMAARAQRKLDRKGR